jgi:hypothetical protein
LTQKKRATPAPPSSPSSLNSKLPAPLPPFPRPRLFIVPAIFLKIHNHAHAVSDFQRALAVLLSQFVAVVAHEFQDIAQAPDQLLLHLENLLPPSKVAITLAEHHFAFSFDG